MCNEILPVKSKLCVLLFNLRIKPVENKNMKFPLIKILTCSLVLMQLLNCETTYSAPDSASAKNKTRFINEKENSAPAKKIPENPSAEIKGFAATWSGNSILLDWNGNSDTFEVERSLNNGKFEMIGPVNGHENSTATDDYTFADEPYNTSGLITYRLKCVDITGKVMYSPSVKVNAINAPAILKKVWYDNTKENVVVVIDEKQETDIQIRIIDMYGRVVASKSVSANSGVSKLVTDMQGLKHGRYIVTIRDITSLFSVQIVKN